MAKTKSQKRAVRALNYDLFAVENLHPPAPATLDTKIRQHQTREVSSDIELMIEPLKALNVLEDNLKRRQLKPNLPSVQELYHLFERYNWLYFKGKLPKVRIEYSKRMMSAGSYTPSHKLIKIGCKYHQLFPEDIPDTLKHEMIHINIFKHNAEFKKEAERVGCSIKAKFHPELRRKPKYLYRCPGCNREYPRQKRFRLASCGYCSPNGEYDKQFKLVLVK